jgi:hypothetical protein
MINRKLIWTVFLVIVILGCNTQKNPSGNEKKHFSNNIEDKCHELYNIDYAGFYGDTVSNLLKELKDFNFDKQLMDDRLTINCLVLTFQNELTMYVYVWEYSIKIDTINQFAYKENTPLDILDSLSVRLVYLDCGNNTVFDGEAFYYDSVCCNYE